MDHPNDIRLIEYGGGRLPEADRAEIDAHLSRCPACTQRCRELAATWRALDAWQAPGESHDLADTVVQAIRAEAAETDPVIGRIGAWPVMRVAASVTVAALLGCTAALMVRPSTRSPGLTEAADPEQAVAELYLDVIANDSPLGLFPVILNPPAPDGEV